MRSRLDTTSISRLIPELPQEEEARKRADLISSLVQGPGPAEGVFPELPGSGPMGLVTPGDIQQFIQRLQELWAKAIPQLYDTFRQPGGTDFVSKLTRDLAMRFAARSVKLISGAQQLRDDTDQPSKPPEQLSD